MADESLMVLASGATELWADGVRSGNRLSGLGEDALEAERPLHLAHKDATTTLCGTSTKDLREYPVDFAGQEQRIRCPICDQRAGYPTS